MRDNDKIDTLDFVYMCLEAGYLLCVHHTWAW